MSEPSKIVFTKGTFNHIDRNGNPTYVDRETRRHLDVKKGDQIEVMWPDGSMSTHKVYMPLGSEKGYFVYVPYRGANGLIAIQMLKFRKIGVSEAP